VASSRDLPLHDFLEPDVEGSLRRETVRALPVVGLGLALLNSFYLVASVVATVQGANPAPWHALRFGLSALAVGGIGLLARRWRHRRSGPEHAIAGVMVLVPLLNSLWELLSSRAPAQSVNVLLVVCALGMLLLTTRWFVLSLVCAWAGWAVAAADDPEAFSVFGFAMVAATLLSGISFVARRRMLERLERSSAEAQRAALVDALTGVYNRRGMEVLAPALLRRATPEGQVTVIAVDIDDMKGINDVHGHAAGDAAVQGAAEVLRASTRVHDVVARTGGDEFIALVDAPAGVGMAERIEDVLRVYLDRTDRPFHLGLSVGAVTMPATVDLPELLDAADAAMYEIKQKRRAAAASPAAAVVPSPARSTCSSAPLPAR